MILNTKVPPELAEVKDAIGVGIYYLALGRMPAEAPRPLPAGECVSVRLRIAGTAKEVFAQAREYFDSDRQTVTNALQLVTELPELARTIKF